LLEREPVTASRVARPEGDARFSQLPQPTERTFRTHGESVGIPSPVTLLTELGVREWFAPLRAGAETAAAQRSGMPMDALALPTLALQVVDRRPAGERPVYDLAVDDLHAFMAGTVAVHNCIGNSGPLPEPVAEAVKANDLVVAAVLSGNRNFEGRIHPQVRASFLASPPLVVAFALAGTVDVDLTTDPLGEDPNGQPVYLRDIWPSTAEITATMAQVVKPEQFTAEYAHVFDGDDLWRALPVPSAHEFEWDPASTYVRQPPFVQHLAAEPASLTDITGARVLVSVGDSVTTDHISPAGSIPADSPAGRYLQTQGVAPRDFNSFGARRGNHEVLMRGTFGNIRLRNLLVPRKEGYWTCHLPDGQEMTIYDAAQQYQHEQVPLIVLAGKEYGTGSSRDWAAKGPLLLGVRATLAESYERIHRSNLIGMGILPLQFRSGEGRESLGLTGTETFDILGIAQDLTPGKLLTVRAHRADGTTVTFAVIARLDGPVDLEYYRQGGILPAVVRRLAHEHPATI
jgi:aconitate hydratase